MRPSTACRACRKRRRKCETVTEGTSCNYCSERKIQCRKSATSTISTPTVLPQYYRQDLEQRSQQYQLSHQQHQVSEQEAQLTQPLTLDDGELPGIGLQDVFPGQALCVELVQLYFEFIHDKYHSLFHRPSFMEDVLREEAPRVILYGMMALSSRFSTDPAISEIDPRERGKGYALECQRLLDFQEVSLTTIQACVLIGVFYTTEGKPDTESLYYSVACRTAQILDLVNRPTKNRIEKEVNIRVWWSLCMIDVWSSFGLQVPRLMPPSDHVPLPMDEATFLYLSRNHGHDPGFEIPAGPPSSLLAQMIKLNRILIEIYDLISKTTSGEAVASNHQTTVVTISRKLEDWSEDLPDYMQDTPENLARYSSQGHGTLFVALYLGFYHFGQLLHYHFLHNECQSRGSSQHHHVMACKMHASKLCNMVYRAFSTPGCLVLYTMVGHILVISSTVQIHTLLFGVDESEIQSARARLEKNFDILTQLRKFWPMLDASHARLRVFNEACRNSMDTSFQMDNWMLRFLSEYGQPVGDKAHGHLNASTRVWKNVAVDSFAGSSEQQIPRSQCT